MASSKLSLPSPSFVVGLLGYSYMPTVCITTMHDQTCQASCRPHSSLGTWLAFAMAFSSCLGLLASVHLCSLFVTFTTLSSVSRKLDGLLGLLESPAVESTNVLPGAIAVLYGI
ncbi:hypothetical protein DITRI_Ditri11bG0003500 [Diplodiscus trichospermus]